MCLVPMLVIDCECSEDHLKTFVVASGVGQFEPDTSNIVSRFTSCLTCYLPASVAQVNRACRVDLVVHEVYKRYTESCCAE